MGNSGFMGGLYTISEWIMRFSVINLLWIIFNLPTVFILLNILLVEKVGDLIIFIIPLAILMPILLFPATTAVFATVRDWIIKNKDKDNLLRSFWHYYKGNYLRSLLDGTIITGVLVILAADIYFFSITNRLIMYLFLMIGIILYVFTINFFSVTVHYRMKLFKSLKSAFLITIGSPVLFIMVIISSGVILYISISMFQVLFVIATCSLIAFLSFTAFYKKHLKAIEKQDQI